MNALSIHPKKKHLGLYFGLPSILMDKVWQTIYTRQPHTPVLRVQKSCQQLIRNYHECPEILCNFKCTSTVYFRNNKHVGTTALSVVLPFGSGRLLLTSLWRGHKTTQRIHITTVISFLSFPNFLLPKSSKKTGETVSEMFRTPAIK